MSVQPPMQDSVVNALDPDIAERGNRTANFRRFLGNPIGVTAAIILTLMVIGAIVLPWVLPGDPQRTDVTNVFAPPSAEHPLGTDSSGRDVLLRLVYASRISLAGMALALIISAVLGVFGGLFAGYYRKWFETLSTALISLLMAIPGILFLLGARSVLGPSFWLTMMLVGVLLSPALFRVVYGSVLSAREEPYVDSARVSGLSSRQIIGRHILTAVRAPLIIQLAMLAGVAVSIQAGLDFLGVGDINLPTWGQMLNDGFTNIYRAPLLIVWPSILVALSCVCFSLLGNALRDTLERTEKVRQGTRPAPLAVVTGSAPGPVDGADAIRVENLTIAYAKPDGTLVSVVEGVDLRIRSGEIHGIVGESGSGKSQTAFAILNLLPDTAHVTSGSLYFDGIPLDAAAVRRRRGRKIAYIPQDPISNLDPSYTVGHQLVEPLRVVLKMPRSKARATALDLLARVGIVDPERVFRAYPHELSGGMAQRVLIAGALSCEPRVLIADEPTTALDVTVQADILDLLRSLQRETGVTVMIITHNFGVVADICDSVSVMKEGQVVESGPVEEVFASPRDEYTRSLLAAVLDNPPARQALPADDVLLASASAAPRSGAVHDESA